MKIAFLICTILACTMALKLHNKMRAMNMNKFKLRNVLKSSRVTTLKSGRKLNMEMKDNKDGTEKKPNVVDEVAYKPDPNAPEWIGYLSNLALRGFGTKFLRGKFEFFGFGFVITSEFVEDDIESILISYKDVLKAHEMADEYQAIGLFHLRHGEVPDMNEQVVQSELEKNAYEVREKFNEVFGSQIKQQAVAASWRLFENCKFNWVESTDQTYSTHQGIEGIFIPDQNGYSSINCRVNRLTYYNLAIYPNNRDHKDMIHEPSNIEVVTQLCNEKKAQLQEAITTYLEKFKVILDIAELKREIRRLEEELISLIKLLGNNIERWAELWFVVGLESSTVDDWVKEIREAIRLQDVDFEFQDNDKIEELELPDNGGKSTRAGDKPEEKTDQD